MPVLLTAENKMACDDLSEDEKQEIFADQDRIAAILGLALSIEIEIAESDLLSVADFIAFANILRKRLRENA